MLGADPTYDAEYYETCMECVCPPSYRGRRLGADGDLCDCVDTCQDVGYGSVSISKSSKSGKGKGSKSKGGGKGKGSKSKGGGKGEKSSKSKGGEASSKGKGGKSSKGYSDDSPEGYSDDSPEGYSDDSVEGKGSKSVKSSKGSSDGSYDEPDCNNEDECFDCFLQYGVCYCYQNGHCMYEVDEEEKSTKSSSEGSKAKGASNDASGDDECACGCTPSSYCTDDGDDCYESCECNDCTSEKTTKSSKSSGKGEEPTPAPYHAAYPTPKGPPPQMGGKGVSIWTVWC